MKGSNANRSMTDPSERENTRKNPQNQKHLDCKTGIQMVIRDDSEHK